MNKCTDKLTHPKPTAKSQWVWFIGIWCLSFATFTAFAYLIKGCVRIALP